MADFLRSALLDPLPHAFSTRRGLDPRDLVAGAGVVRLRQIHSNRVLVADGPWEDLPDGDALVTDRAGLLLEIVTADCAPVLLADPGAGVVAAVHAGWRGAVSGVIENAVAAMSGLGAEPSRIRAAIGPAIARESYEVDESFRAQFEEEDDRFFAAGRAGHFQFDLPAYVAHRLSRAGVGQVDDLQQDTYAQDEKFFSFRRATHRGEETGGRQVSVIGRR